MNAQRASELHRGSTFYHGGQQWLVIDVRPTNVHRGLYRFQARNMVGTVEQFEFYDDMTRFIIEGDKVK